MTATAPIRVMRNALRDAGIEPHQVDYINAHGTSTEVGDRAETAAIKRAFGDHAYKVAVSSTKSMTGHLLGGAGGLEAGITVLAIRDQIAPPTINYENPDPDCDLDYVPEPGAPDEDRVCALEQFRLRRHQRLPDFQAIPGIGAERQPGLAGLLYENRRRDQTGSRARFAIARSHPPASGSRRPISATRSTSPTPTPWKQGCN